MQEVKFSEIKTTYYYGGYVTLTPSWNEYDVICPYAKLYFVTDGEINVKVNGKTHTLKKGDATLIPAGVKHSYFLSADNFGSKYWFHFDLTQGGDYFSKLNYNYVTKIKEYDDVIKLFKQIAIHESAKDVYSKLTVSGAVNLIVALFLKNADAQRANVDFDDVDKIINLIQENPFNDYTLENLADFIHLSPNYLIRKFKERTGFTPIKFVTYLKIERAKTLIENTDKSIYEVMTETGFDDPAYFSKLFKSQTGYSPKRFREIYGNKGKKFSY